MGGSGMSKRYVRCLPDIPDAPYLMKEWEEKDQKQTANLLGLSETVYARYTAVGKVMLTHSAPQPTRKKIKAPN